VRLRRDRREAEVSPDATTERESAPHGGDQHNMLSIHAMENATPTVCDVANANDDIR